MTLTTSHIQTLASVPPDAWDALVGQNNPFVEHAFLSGLEVTGCVGGEGTGWLPRHVLVHRGAQLVGAMPLYLKLDSYGEYIFDWAWANASTRAGVPYYPKLVSSVPFTPATGPRLLIHPEADREEICRCLLTAVEEAAESEGAWSAHVLFCTLEERESLARGGLIPRTTYQFHWENPGEWEGFDDYLGALRSRARKEVRRERRLAAAHGLDLQMRRGHELTDADWAALWGFYQSTTTKKYAIPYLTPAFFDYAREHLKHRTVASMAYREGVPVAGSLSFQKGDTLFGRYWGASEDLDQLHFEVCYYQPIAWCLAHGIRRFEAGAQGEHKLKRGFLPRPTYSASSFRVPQLGAAVTSWVKEEGLDVEAHMEALNGHSPYRAGEGL